MPPPPPRFSVRRAPNLQLGRLRGAGFAAFAGLLVAGLFLGCGARSPIPPTSIPEIGRWAGIQLGETTMEELEARLGPGHTVTGGHPNGARLWRVPGVPWLIHADAFEYSPGGVVVDSLDLTYDFQPDPQIPWTRATTNELAWFGTISLGMPEASLVAALNQTRSPIIPTEHGWKVTAPGFAPLVQNQSFQHWTAEFECSGKQLIRISLGAQASSETP